MNTPINAYRPLLCSTQYWGGSKEAYGNTPVLQKHLILPHDRHQIATITLTMKISAFLFSLVVTTYWTLF